MAFPTPIVKAPAKQVKRKLPSVASGLSASSRRVMASVELPSTVNGKPISGALTRGRKRLISQDVPSPSSDDPVAKKSRST